MTNQIVDRKLWSGTTGEKGLEVQVTAPQSNGYDLIFEQYDGCSGSCFKAQTQQGLKNVRLIWRKVITYYSYNGYAAVSPEFIGNYTICN